MSAERECFKKIGKLLASFHEQAVPLIRETLVEFMEDHPEVEALRFSVSTSSFKIKHGKGDHWHDSIALVESEPKLAACLMALERNFLPLKDVITHLFEKSTVHITHQNVKDLWANYIYTSI